MPAVLPRSLAVTLALLFASATITLAADSGARPAAPPPAHEPAAPAVVVVPDVRKQAYVFAKGTLEEAGLAWKVVGSVQGFAANVVALQSPAPGTRLVDTGAPTITLELTRNPAYAQQGEPENSSPYPGTPLRLADHVAEPLAPETSLPSAPAAPKQKSPPAAKKQPAAKKPAAKKPAAKKPAAKKPAAKKQAPVKKQPAARPPAFAVPGAPKEPRNEITLPARAKQLARWLDTHPKPTDANVRHWLYQHEWIVAGARFGWHGGESALVELVATDRRVEALWGIGTKSRLQAQRALGEVRERSR